jgi:hypothetical protein
MFRSTITRPLLWAIPLAVVAAIAAALIYFRPLTIDVGRERVPCGGIVTFDAFDPCGGLRRTRFLVSALILALGGLPLLIVVVRACVLAADSIAALRDEVRRLHERLDSGP